MLFLRNACLSVSRTKVLIGWLCKHKTSADESFAATCRYTNRVRIYGVYLMDQLLVLPTEQGISEQLLGALRQAGWRITVTLDMVRAKQLLQKGDIAALILESDPSKHDVDRMKILRFVQEFCRGTLVILLCGGTDKIVSPGGRHVVEALNSV